MSRDLTRLQLEQTQCPRSHRRNRRSALPLPTPEEVVRISVDRYEQMIASGVLGEDDPIELLNGVMVWKMPKNPMHFTVTRRCARGRSSVCCQTAGTCARRAPFGSLTTMSRSQTSPWCAEMTTFTNNVTRDRATLPSSSRSRTAAYPGIGARSVDDLRPGQYSRLLDYQPGRRSDRDLLPPYRGHLSYCRGSEGPRLGGTRSRRPLSRSNPGGRPDPLA